MIVKKVVVHILSYGLPLCRFSTALPSEWPAGNKWVGLEDLSLATCAGCLEIADKKGSSDQ